MTLTQGANVFKEDFNVSGLNRTQVRNLVNDGMRSAGWASVVDPASPSGVIIYGFFDPRNNILPIEKINVSTRGVLPNQLPIVGGLRIDGSSTLYLWGVQINATDSTGTVQEDVAIDANIDGVDIQANVTTGMTPNDVAFALYTAMQNDGITGAVLSGNNVTFSTDTLGQPVNNISLQFTGSSGGSPAAFLGTEVDLPNLSASGGGT